MRSLRRRRPKSRKRRRGRIGLSTGRREEIIDLGMNYPHQCDHFFFFSTLFLVIAMILYVALHLWYHIVVFLHSIVGSWML
ncbi:hypothetical protein ZEAMMB73_Zm00001d024656 [Zea mays]|jgi:hypothetical protein|uniref:Uncharacterized protein n=1 Tax=Zea mays TaxID=4577 RepID=A0A1D6J0V2_MAIZE|nr:hypothetical protein ZEAMMB73_Zm00001d024656 [Zea mays]